MLDGSAVGAAGNDLLVGFRNIIGASAGSLLIGNNANNLITGGAGADTIRGLDGPDTIEGGAGADTMDGGVGVDTLIYASSPSAVTVNLSVGTASGGLVMIVL